MELGYQIYQHVKVCLFYSIIIIFSSILFTFIEKIPCSIPPLPQTARYINLRPFMKKLNDGTYLEYMCENSKYRQRIICRQGKILPQKPMCYNGNIYFNKYKSLQIYVYTAF